MPPRDPDMVELDLPLLHELPADNGAEAEEELPTFPPIEATTGLKATVDKPILLLFSEL